ncbi:MAG: tetratricopeptide repeat protein [Pyrinomonadaceae bacterium]
MQLPLTQLSRLADYWHSLSEGTRDGIISGLVVAAVLAAVGLVIKFGKRITRAISSIFRSEAPPANQQQEVKVKIEVAPAPPILPAAPAESVQPTRTTAIPRPPAFGFVARRDQDGRDIVERLKEELAPERDQLIVLWGAGGVGKTTLAAETARALRKSFAGGIAWISAEGRPDFDLSTLLDEIAGTLRRPDLRQLALELKNEQVSQALADAPIPLIVLDNFETISPEEQGRCAAWLAKRASCPALITSRDAAPHARPVHILAMSLPEADEFLQKLITEARKPQAFVELDRDQIIQAADRIPLVMQWVVKQIDSANQPQTVLEDLTHGKGDAAQRVFDRSFELLQLGDDGRAALLALSLFVPSASRAALAEVAGLDDRPERLNDAVQQLAELWLIETTEGNERLSVEGLTRELAKARFLKLNHEGEVFRKRFVAYFGGYAEAHAQSTPEDYDALETEKDNLLTAMDVAFEMKDWDAVSGLAYVIALPVSGVLSVHGYWEEALKRNEQALKAARESLFEIDVSKFSHNQAVMHGNRGELEEARQLYNESLGIKQKLGDQSGIAITLHQLAMLAQNQGELEEARRLYNKSLKINKKLGVQSVIASTLHQLAVLAQDKGEFGEARRLYNESLEIEKKLGNQRGIALTLHELGRLAQNQGEVEEARRLYNESLEIQKKLGNQSGIALTLHELGRLAENQGEVEEARRLYNQSLDIDRRLGDPNGLAISLFALGTLSETQSNMDEAAQMFREALAILERLGSPHADVARQSLARVLGDSS